MNKYSKSDRRKAEKFKERELSKYSEFTYKEVATLKKKGRQKIKSPPGLEHFNFALEVKKNDDGGLELSVFHYDLPPYDEVPDWINEASGIDDITQGESSFRLWFDIYKVDSKNWPSFEHTDDD